jgi:hypothetical protein
MFNRNHWVFFLVGLIIVLVTNSTLAHHGWRWTTGNNIELTGTIVEAQLGNPHGILSVQVNDENWTIEVGQPWRNEQAGLKPSDLAPGVEITAVGEPSNDPEQHVLKAERLRIGGTLYELYPERS